MGLDSTTLGILAALVPLALFSVGREVRRQRAARTALARARVHGLDEPVSLHPIIDPTRCVGCGSCVTACPEGDVLMLVNGRARLVNAAHCVGHGACKTACPQDAIDLVFGTSKRGIQIPQLKADYQTNVPGVYIVGELGGMGLIRNAISQGIQAVGHIARSFETPADPGFTDVAIVGAGPAGIAAALACRQHQLSYVLLDQDGLGGSINHYPRRKLVMTAPVDLPGVGTMHFREVGKEELLRFWTRVVRETRIEIRAPERVNDVRHVDGGFEVSTDRGVVRARRVVLAVGRRGTPRKLGVPGEQSDRVAYRLLEPERWSGMPVLVVGGGNSAVEATFALAEAGARTTLSYRSQAFNRVAAANLERLESARRRFRLEILLESQVSRIEPQRVVLETPAGPRVVDNEQIFVLIGGELPTGFLERIGIHMQWHHGERPSNGRATAGGRA
jgi:thioredoxin reductase/Pyruvate/2-oxoacid:ferredoxin oxidoreductase delta subunit